MTALLAAAPKPIPSTPLPQVDVEEELDFATAHYAAVAFRNAYRRYPDPISNSGDRTVCHLLYEAMRACADAVYTATGDQDEVEKALALLARRR